MKHLSAVFSSSKVRLGRSKELRALSDTPGAIIFAPPIGISMPPIASAEGAQSEIWCSIRKKDFK
jgi:hypothetical protein